MTHAPNPEQEAARRKELARLWLRQLSSLLHQFGFREAFSRIDAKGSAICLRDEHGVELRLRTYDGAWRPRWHAHLAKVPGSAKLQTGGGLLSTSVRTLEDAQALVYERLLKPLR